MADEVLLMCWPPAPEERKVSMRRSFGLISSSTSSASGMTATVTVEVWMRPWVSVSGTRWTRWTPLSNFRRLYTSGPSTEKTISFTPPSSVSLALMVSHCQPRLAAYIVYMRHRLWANKAASSPPAPARISKITLFSSSASLGISSKRKFSSLCARFRAISQSSCCTIAANAGSDSATSISLASFSCCCRSV